MKKNRIEWIDTIKAIGLFLVFFGHHTEKLYFVEGVNGTATIPYKFIYSFLMQMFFFLSGFFAKRQDDKLIYIKKLFFRRLVPVFSFAIIFVPLWLIYNKFVMGHFMIQQIVIKALDYFGGDPQLDFMTWFLVCLFTAELIIGLLGLISSSRFYNLLLGFLLIVLGYYIVNYISFISAFTRLKLNFWYIHEGIIAAGFYLIGNSLFGFISKLEQNRKWIFYLIIPVTLLLIKLSIIYFKNTTTVIMADSVHGDLLPFVVNSFLGTILIISIGIIIPPNKIMNFIGLNTLILLGLNGVFYHFIDSFLINWFYLNDSIWFLILYCTFASTISMALCAPFIILINKYLPQLFGKPNSKGPILKPLEYYTQLFRKKTHNILYK